MTPQNNNEHIFKASTLKEDTILYPLASPKPPYIYLIVPSNSVPNRGQEIEKPEFNTSKGPEVTTDCEHLGITNKEGA